MTVTKLDLYFLSLRFDLPTRFIFFDRQLSITQPARGQPAASGRYQVSSEKHIQVKVGYLVGDDVLAMAKARVAGTPLGNNPRLPTQSRKTLDRTP
jgi:hypothetical protein